VPESPPIIQRKGVIDGVRRGVSIGFRGEGFGRCLYRPKKISEKFTKRVANRYKVGLQSIHRAAGVGRYLTKQENLMSGKIKLAAWLTITALLFSIFNASPLGLVFAFTLSGLVGFAALVDHLENVAERGVK